MKAPPLAHTLLAAALLAPGARAAGAAPWNPDAGGGRYRNPVIFADYSDPDAIRVGREFYLTASSFLAVPGLPILRSEDLVHWTIIGHALAELVPAAHYARPRHGDGVWAPAIRYHAGKYWITYPDPDYGIYLTTARNPAGPWSPPVLIEAGKGLIDPCPFWDDDGQLYLIHAWARSRAGVANILTLQRLSPDGRRALGPGRTIIDGNAIPGWNTLEGPKLYKRDGTYYVFAPAGGVTGGYQAVFRSRRIDGPYEHRIVLAQGRTAINGPHQGAWVETASGQDWFLHFQDRGPYGRVVWLEPMRWRDGWPLIGADSGGTGTGEPVLQHRLPDVGGPRRFAAPQTSDEFGGRRLGLQWQWNANPRPGWDSLAARPGWLRLASVRAPATRDDGGLYDAPNFLLQKFPAPAFTATARLECFPAGTGERAGLAVFGFNCAVLALERTADGPRLVLAVALGANRPGARERTEASVAAPGGPAELRVAVGSGAVCRFSYRFGAGPFRPLGGPFPAAGDRWIGAKVGLIASAPSGAAATGYADFDWFRVAPAGAGGP